MQRFKFALQSVMKYRQFQLDVERARTEELLAAITRVEGDRQHLESKMVAEDRSVKYQGAVEPLELLALDAFARAAENQQGKLLRRKRELLSALEDQKRKALQAQRNLDLLDRLKNKRHAEWSKAEAAEVESMAFDAYLAKRAPPDDTGA